jgi:hypothetical protein
MLHLLLLVLLLLVRGELAAAYRTRLDPGAGSECFTDTILPGGSLSVSFEVTAGGAKDIDATLSVLYTDESRAQASSTARTGILSADHSALLTSRQLQEWKKTTSGSYEYNAPAISSALAVASSEDNNQTPSPREGGGKNIGAGAGVVVVLPHKVTLCFDNSVSRWTPKWVSFAFVKQETVLEDQVLSKATVEHEMELALHESGQTLFHLQTLMVKVKNLEEKHRAMIETVNTWVMAGAFVSGLLLVGMAVFQYWFLTRFLSARALRL